MPLNGACRKRARRNGGKQGLMQASKLSLSLQLLAAAITRYLPRLAPNRIFGRGDASWSGQVPGGGTDGRLVGVAQSGNATVASLVRAPSQTFQAEGAVTRVRPSC